MNTCSITKLDSFMIDFLEIKPSKQLEFLNSTINSSITYFKTAYIFIDETNITDIKLLFDNGYNSIINIGYEFVAKIHSMLNILQISDTSQTNKFKYEESAQILFGSGIFLNIFNDLALNIFNEKINEYMNMIKILDTINENIFTKLCNDKNIFSLNSKINNFNHYINELILQMCKIKLILKYTYIHI